MQASMRNCRNQASDAKGEAQGQKPRGESTDALVWGGPACSSDEGFVMELERCAVISRCFSVGDNPTRELVRFTR
jgi:hypothetical protein